MKKLLTIVMALILVVVAGVSCGGNESNSESTPASGSTSASETTPVTPTGVKVGLLALHDINSTYDKNFIDAFNAACAAKGVEAVIKTNIEEGENCKTEALNLVDDGCKLVFADSFGHEPYLREAAEASPDVQFCHATGTTAQTDKSLSNFHNAFASIYEGRYIAGYAAGLKLVEMYNANNAIAKDGVINVGYVGAYPYAEVKSGYTSWLLGVRKAFYESVKNVTVNMIVEFTNSWYNETFEKDAANVLIQKGCAIISQHADSWGAPVACETAGVPNVSYNGSTISKCPNTFIISSRINWQPYFEYIIDCVLNNRAIDADWTGDLGETFATGSVCLTELGGKAPAAGTQAKIEEVAKQLKAGTIRVFDVSTFTVSKAYAENAFAALTGVTLDDNKHLTSAKQNGVEVIKEVNGIKYFDESCVSTNRSAPYFDIDIDGITLNLKA